MVRVITECKFFLPDWEEIESRVPPDKAAFIPPTAAEQEAWAKEMTWRQSPEGIEFGKELKRKFDAILAKTTIKKAPRLVPRIVDKKAEAANDK
jgi:hypothetical protein